MRDDRLDVVRCLMNYMIVLLHACAAFQYVDRTTIEFKGWTFVLSHLCWMAIPSFFVISGYLFFARFSMCEFGHKLFRRVKRLLTPYLVWNVTFVLFYFAMARLVPRLATRVATFGLATFGGAMSKIVSLTIPPIDGPLWFLRVLILLAVFSPFLFALMRLWRGSLALILCMLWMVIESWLGWTSTTHFTLPAYALVCYVAGGALVMNGFDLARSFSSWGWVVLGLMACVARWTLIITPESPWGLVLLGNFLAVLEAPALLSLVNRLPCKKMMTNRGFVFFQKMSFFAYAGHFLFCSMFLHVLAPLFAFMTVGKFTVLILIFFCCGVPTMAAIFALGRCFCPRALKFWDGSL